MRFRVTCDAMPPAGSRCSFNGHRKARSAEEAEGLPCPRCGGPVQATPVPIGRRRPDLTASPGANTGSGR
jgi:hypothetical protein